MNEHTPIAFLGLGALGAPIAANLLASGHRLTVWNRSAEKTKPLAEKGALVASTPVEAITPGGVVFSILWDNASLEELVANPGFFEKLGPNGVHVSMTTVSPQTSRKVAELHRSHGTRFVEAPIFGPPEVAVAKQLLLCVAGDAVDKARVKPLLEAMGAARVFDFGDIGATTATKLVGNYMIISAFGAMNEAFVALKANGVDPKPTIEMLTTTLLATPGNQRYAAYLLSNAPLPTSGIPEKDLGLFRDFAKVAPLAEAQLAQLKKR